MANPMAIFICRINDTIGFNARPSTDNEIKSHLVSNRRIADPSPRGGIAMDSRTAGTGLYYKSKLPASTPQPHHVRIVFVHDTTGSRCPTSQISSCSVPLAPLASISSKRNARDSFGRIAIFTSPNTVSSKADELNTLRQKGVDILIGDVGNRQDVLKAYAGILLPQSTLPLHMHLN